MRRNRSQCRRQTPFSVPTVEVCLLSVACPIFPRFDRHVTSIVSFFLTPHFDQGRVDGGAETIRTSGVRKQFP
jgi:hypothetical protein